MKISGVGRLHRFKKNSTLILLVLLFFFRFCVPDSLECIR